MNPSLKKQLTSILFRAEKEAAEWLKEHEDVERKVRQILDKQLQTIVAQLAGFDFAFGRWEISFRKDNAMALWMWKTTEAAIKNWIDEQVTTLPKLSSQVIKDLKKEYLLHLEEEAQRILFDLANEKAKELVDSMYAELNK